MKKSTYGYTNLYLTKDGEPWFPVMGEFHYSRFPEEEWEKSLNKMKSGGVDIVSSYVIWIHHEKNRGEYDFSGNKNLRKFIELIDKCGMKMILRLGPWCHAEVRYGGFPKWICEDKSIKLRRKDAGYLNYIREYFTKIYEQISGLLHKDGGPIIGLQAENECGHAGVGVRGKAAQMYMDTLVKIVKDIGFDAPLFTATGWGGAVIGDCIPVMGGYCEAPWEKTSDELSPNSNYVITYERDDHNIGKGRPVGYGALYDLKDYPYLTAELGGGLQITYDRRPVAYAKDIGAVTLVKLASGVNLLGYYMYHGGRNLEPDMHETKATGSWCELPEFNYDFRAPIGAYGQISDTYRELKLFTMFLKDFGKEFCAMPAYIPDTTPDTPMNLTDLRVSVRHNGESGYVFVNNYQRRYKMAGHKNVRLTAKLPGETVYFPKIDISDGQYFFYPFNFNIGNAVIKTALATPFCKLNEDIYVFYSDRKDDGGMADNGAKRTNGNSDIFIRYGDTRFDIEGNIGGARIVCLTRETALNAWKIKKDREYLVICGGAVIDENGSIKIADTWDGSLKIYPKPSFNLKDYEYGSGCGDAPDADGFYVLTPKSLKDESTHSRTKIYFEEIKNVADMAAGGKNISENTEICDKKTCGVKKYNVHFEYAENISDCFASVDFDGNTGRLCVDGKTVDDWFYTGEPWVIGLKQLGFPTEIEIEFKPLYSGDDIFLEKRPDMTDGRACAMRKITARDEYEREL